MTKKTMLRYRMDNLAEAIGDSAHPIDLMERIYNKTRGQHNTAALIKCAQQTNALIVCHSVEWAEQLAHDHKVNATVYTDPKIISYEGPIVIDMPCMFEIVKKFHVLQKQSIELLGYMQSKGME